MTTRRKHIVRKVIHILMFMSVFALAPQAIEYYFLQSMPASYWVEYSAIEVRDKVNFNDNHLDVLSFAVIKRPVLIEWSDVLFCDNGKGAAFTDSQSDSRYFTERTVLPRVDKDLFTGQDRFVPWRFQIDSNIQAEEYCFIQSSIKAKLRFDIEKVVGIKSNTFVVQ